MAKIWAIQFDGQEPFRLDDLPYGRFQAIADQYGVAWPLLKRGPMTNMAAYVAVLGLAAELLEIDPPTTPVTLGDIDRLGELLVLIEDDLPKAGTNITPSVGEPTTDG